MAPGQMENAAFRVAAGVTMVHKRSLSSHPAWIGLLLALVVACETTPPDDDTVAPDDDTSLGDDDSAPLGDGPRPAPPDPDEGGSFSATADPATGGTLSSPSKSIVVEVPPGAVSSATTLTLDILPAVDGSLSSVYELGPTGTNFASPVTITLAFDGAAAFQPGQGETAIPALAFGAAGGGWTTLADSIVTTNSVSGSSAHFTPFAVVAIPNESAARWSFRHWSPSGMQLTDPETGFGAVGLSIVDAEGATWTYEAVSGFTVGADALPVGEGEAPAMGPATATLTDPGGLPLALAELDFDITPGGHLAFWVVDEPPADDKGPSTPTLHAAWIPEAVSELPPAWLVGQFIPDVASLQFFACDTDFTPLTRPSGAGAVEVPVLDFGGAQWIPRGPSAVLCVVPNGDLAERAWTVLPEPGAGLPQVAAAALGLADPVHFPGLGENSVGLYLETSAGVVATGFNMGLPPSLTQYAHVEAGPGFACAYNSTQSHCWGAVPPGVARSYSASEDLIDLAIGDGWLCRVHAGNGWGCEGAAPDGGPIGAPSLMDGFGSAICAIVDGGTVNCWGTGTDPEVIDNVPPGNTFVDVQVGEGFACALDASGAVECWGAGDNQVVFGGGAPPVVFTQLAAGESHVCGISPDIGSPNVACWGSNGYDQSDPSILVGDVSVLYAGGETTCAQMQDGTLACFGRDDEGQAQDHAGLSPTVENPRDVSLGPDYACAVRGEIPTEVDADVSCWGASAEGQAAGPTNASVGSPPATFTP